MKLPRFYKILQKFPCPRIVNVEEKVTAELDRSGITFPQGASIALTAGSRGISDSAIVMRTAVRWLRNKGVRPFIVPAMGSHGGATAQGQIEILASNGITEKLIGAPIVSSMEVVAIGTAGIYKVYMDRAAWESDGVVVINRIKPHTDYHGDHESGLVKMCVIGLGKQAQAHENHMMGVQGLKKGIPEVAKTILGSGKVILGIGIVENAYDETAEIEAVRPEFFFERDCELLKTSRRLMPSLPVDRIDLLIIDIMGKEISGVGMDTNIIGRIRIRGEEEPRSPSIKSIVVTDLSAPSHGNALGIGLADCITRRLFDKIDFGATYENVYAATFFERAKVPVIAENDAQAVHYGLRACGFVEPGNERIVRIRDTLHLDTMYVSAPVFDDLHGRENIKCISGPLDIIEQNGSLSSF